MEISQTRIYRLILRGENLECFLFCHDVVCYYIPLYLAHDVIIDNISTLKKTVYFG